MDSIGIHRYNMRRNQGLNIAYNQRLNIAYNQRLNIGYNQRLNIAYNQRLNIAYNIAYNIDAHKKNPPGRKIAQGDLPCGLRVSELVRYTKKSGDTHMAVVVKRTNPRRVDSTS